MRENAGRMPSHRKSKTHKLNPVIGNLATDSLAKRLFCRGIVVILYC
jgi:hypothetical protein